MVPSVTDHERDAQARSIVADVARRRLEGEAVDDDQVISANPAIAAELRAAFDVARTIHMAMLAAHHRHNETSAIDLPIAETSDPDRACWPVIVGYSLRGIIGHGSQGVVYEAVQETTGRKVALKVMSWDPAEHSRKRERFAREVEILASIEHPHIVTVIDRGRTPEGSHFFVMPFISGSSLEEWLEARRSGASEYVREVLGMFATIARAIDEAHRMGVVHRDLKPANIRVDRFDRPHVLDFGLARKLDASPRPTSTQLGNVVGSLPWCSPEQASGDLSNLDGRSDIYSLGVMLHHALTGAFPYPVTGRIRDVINRITGHTRSEAPTIAHDRPPIRPAVGAILNKALSRSLAERYATASELADDIDRFIRGVRPLAYASGRRRNKRQRITGVVAIFAMTVAGIVVAVAINRVSATDRFVSLPGPVQTNSIGMQLARIAAGMAVLGKPPDMLGHTVSGAGIQVRVASAFWISTTEVTRGQYRSVMKVLPNVFNNQSDLSDDLPITSITKDDAMKFCAELSAREGRTYRLPTDVEWEYACRVGSSSLYSGSANPNDVAWSVENSGERLQPVARKRPNGWGLYDMHGNAGELTIETKLEQQQKRAINPFGENDPPRFFVRGGCATFPAIDCTSASRMLAPSTPDRMTGFRVVLDARD